MLTNPWLSRNPNVTLPSAVEHNPELRPPVPARSQMPQSRGILFIPHGRIKIVLVEAKKAMARRRMVNTSITSTKKSRY
jgi:hypothetical protein